MRHGLPAGRHLAPGAGMGGGEGEVLRVFGAEGLPHLFQHGRGNAPQVVGAVEFVSFGYRLLRLAPQRLGGAVVRPLSSDRPSAAKR